MLPQLLCMSHLHLLRGRSQSLPLSVGSRSFRVVLDIKGVPNPAPILPLNLQGSLLLPWRKIFDLQVLQTHLRLYPSLEGGSKEDYPDSAQI